MAMGPHTWEIVFGDPVFTHAAQGQLRGSAARDVGFSVDEAMIVYRAQEREVETASRLHEMNAVLHRLERSSFTDHAGAVELLIEFGEFEAAVADALSTDANLLHPTVTALGRISLLIDRIFCRSWKRAADETGAGGSLSSTLPKLATLPLPQTLRIRVPEGYAYYGLYAEAYLEAAESFWNDAYPRKTTCLGIRSIGTSLPAVVAATLEERGCPTDSYTVRCQGHPFERRLVLDPVLEDRFRADTQQHFLIVDEGPGLSGSSLCSVAQKLADLGVPDERIVFFPSRDIDGTDLLSETARRRWPRHRRYVVSFEDTWLRSGRLAQSLPPGTLVDISAGQWRPLLFRDESQYPAVQPWHERRKYLCLRQPAATAQGSTSPGSPHLYEGRNSPPLLLKFAGLGRYGRVAYTRAKLLADAGFHPPVLGLTDGFLVMEFVPGQPMTAASIDGAFLDRAVRYLAYLSHTPALGTPMPHAELVGMIEVNVAEALGPSWAQKLLRVKAYSPADNALLGTVDGRMMLHEWLRLPGGYLKTDAVDHQTDHFSPGCRDIAWDVAACLTEWGLDRPMQNYLIGEYRLVAHDDALPQRLPFYTIAYLAHRVGYASLAVQVLGPHTPDGARFKALVASYTTQLQQELSRL